MSEARAPLVVVLSGPNLDLLGERQPEVYGHARSPTTSPPHARKRLRAVSTSSTTRPTTRASSSSWSTRPAAGPPRSSSTPGALTHYSWSLHDALAAFDGIVVELHLSNPAAREPFRHTSVVAPVAHGAIAGFGGLGYPLAVQAVARLLAERSAAG